MKKILVFLVFLSSSVMANNVNQQKNISSYIQEEIDHLSFILNDEQYDEINSRSMNEKEHKFFIAIGRYFALLDIKDFIAEQEKGSAN